MIAFRRIAICLFCLSLAASAQTAEELVAKNIQARGGLEKIKAINTLRLTANLDQGGFKAVLGQESKRPSFYRTTVTIQGMTRIQAYDGATAWQISPFSGKKDAELLSEDDSRDLVEEADFDGPLVDAQAKGNKIEYLGMDQVDGDDAYKLKATLKNGDIFYYYLDPDTYMVIQIDRERFIRGSVNESVTVLGSYKPVNGVMFPFSIAAGSKTNPNARARITVEKMEANVPVNDADFKFPATSNSEHAPAK